MLTEKSLSKGKRKLKKSKLHNHYTCSIRKQIPRFLCWQILVALGSAAWEISAFNLNGWYKEQTWGMLICSENNL